MRRRRRLRSMLLAGVTLVAPNAANPLVVGPPAVARVVAAPSAPAPVPTMPVAEVTTSETFWLLPDQAYEALIQEAAIRYALEPALIRAVIRTESSFNPLAVSSAGAQGLMQLMPALAAELGVADAFDPRANIMAGSQHLSTLLGDHNGNIALALASYNAGSSVVDHYHGIPPFEETQRYVSVILGLLARGADAPG